VSEVFSLHDPSQRSAGLVRAKDSLNRSGLVVMPTDTVYGVAADAFDPTGVRRLLRAKGRGRDMPTPVLIASAEVLPALATGVTSEARQLADAFWPGGLTLIFRQQSSLRWDLGDSRGTVAMRVPDHEDALSLLADTGPLAVSSANTTGSPAPVTIEQAQEMLAEAIDVYLDAGPTPGAVPSTIVDATGDVLIVRRQGVIDVEALRAVVSTLEVAEPG
jgi:tRNA threonylcarbamoyl adenosine modification protein (Sua5/YciO/YrdC/YwlC family)